MKEILETSELGNYQLVVCGGGVAGIAAAVSAKRAGLNKVLLVDKQVNLGGLATVGLISWFEPVCDGRGKLFAEGLAKELFDLAMNCGPNSLPEVWKSGTPTGNDPRCSAFFSPTLFSIALDCFLEKEGVEVLLDTVVVKPVMDSSSCNGVIVENKTGRGFYRADAIVDCTGDLDVFYRAGAPCEEGQNYLTYIAYLTDIDTCDAAGNGDLLQSRRWVTAGSDLWGNGHPEGFPKFSGVTAEEVTSFVRAGRRLYMEKLNSGHECGQFDISVLPSMPHFRTTRRLIGEYTLLETDEGKPFDDSIGRICDFVHRDKQYEIPFRCLYSRLYDNMFTAGRTISSAGWAWDVTRVIPAAVLTGQAAGVGAAIAVLTKMKAAELDVSQVQQELKAGGVKLHLKD